MSKEKVFANGMIVKVREDAPEWAICKLSIKVEDFVEFLKENEDKGWVNLDVNVGRTGNAYASLDDWKPSNDGGKKTSQKKVEDDSEDDVPF
jgi:hypothetical protein